MADITVTAANVRPGADAITRIVTAGAAVTAGDTVYLDVSENEWIPAFAYLSAGEAAGLGGIAIALTNAADTESLVIQTAGTIIIGGTVVKGQIYVLGSGAGGIAPASDLTTGWYSTRIGHGISTTEIELDLKYTGQLLA